MSLEERVERLEAWLFLAKFVGACGLAYGALYVWFWWLS